MFYKSIRHFLKSISYSLRLFKKDKRTKQIHQKTITLYNFRSICDKSNQAKQNIEI